MTEPAAAPERDPDLDRAPNPVPTIALRILAVLLLGLMIFWLFDDSHVSVVATGSESAEVYELSCAAPVAGSGVGRTDGAGAGRPQGAGDRLPTFDDADLAVVSECGKRRDQRLSLALLSGLGALGFFGWARHRVDARRRRRALSGA